MSSLYSSVYLALRPRAFSTGYRRAEMAIFSLSNAEASISSCSQMSSTKYSTSASSWPMACRLALSLSCSSISSLLRKRKCSNSSAASIDRPTARSLGVWNCLHSRSSTNWRMVSLSSVTVLASSYITDPVDLRRGQIRI